MGITEPQRNVIAALVRAFICDLGPGDHGHTDCWHLSMAAEVIEASDEQRRRAPREH